MITNKENLVQYFDELLPDAHCELNYHNEYELLILVILSAQATDKSVNKIAPILFGNYPNFKSLAVGSYKVVQDIIKSLGLSTIKARRIINVAQTIVTKFNNKIPESFDELISIDGIGRKTANVVLVELYHQQAFPVDTHINRIAHRLLIAKKEDSILETEKKLVEFFAGSDFKKLHHQLIAFGRYYCTARNPKCETCKIKCLESLGTFLK